MSRKLEDSNIPLGYATAGRGETDTYDRLRQVWSQPNREQVLREQEDAYLDFMFSWISSYAKDEKGEWKRQAARVPAAFAADLEARGIAYTKVKGTDKLSMKTLPGAYITAKNVLERAEKAGLDYMGVGKSDLEKQMRIPKDAFTRATDAANTLVKVWSDLTQVQRTAILETISPLED